MNPGQHRPVLKDEALAALAIRPDGVYIDATYGRGGHSRAILAALGARGRLIAIDQDPDAAADACQLAAAEPRLTFVRGSFADLRVHVERLDRVGRIDGILFDLGVSSPQFDVAERGFSFRHAGALDMRMNPGAGRPLGEWLASASPHDIAAVIRRYGEEPMARRIAAAIIGAREAGGLTDTAALGAIVKAAVPARVAAGKRIHPATRTFQAFRLFINDELGALDAVLGQTLAVLAAGGRLAMICFHSLEDRRVKRFMRRQAKPKQPPLPMAEPIAPALALIGKPTTAGAAEREYNPRARSAIMRVAERTEAPEVGS